MSKIQSQVSADTNDGSAGTVATQAFASAFTAGNLVWGHVIWSGGTVTLNSVSDGTNSYTIDQTTGPDANAQMCATFHKENVAATGASPVLTATFSVATTFRRIRGEERSGIVSTSALDKKAAQFSATFGTGTDAVTSGSQTTVSDGDQIVGVAYDSSTATLPSVGTGFSNTDGVTFIAGDCFRTEDKVQSSHGAVAATFTTTAGTDPIHVHMLALVSSGGGGGGGTGLAESEWHPMEPQTEAKTVSVW